ncbi:RAD3-like DEAD/DEAH box helicase [Kribbella orskensis]|uniref:RAD3-like DEAD/DEAH box helicase n=1 Tax=Kribbella orskensis TaxID=2512216 RepID=A0ABY2BH19_9ACTN|nr:MULTISPECIES: DEAD/DEAH box helicase [Kribbella]TCN27658.1 RAD3-like DEAD/DEAH box helicase [Kribbella sp. VKM Ac-2500]TCO19600.1 RAD3-like DEAD/DEAH box helicase [Kribbella orskensis]
MIRRDGVLPDEAAQFGTYLDDDLLNYSYALMSASLQLLDATDTDSEDEDAGETAIEPGQVAKNGFIQASHALEAATRNAVPAEELAFHRLIAGAASHLGGYAARAFSLMQASIQSGRLTPMEATLADLVLRDLNGIEDRTRRLRLSDDLVDDALLEALEDDEEPEVDAIEAAPESVTEGVGPIVLLLSEHYLSAVSAALFAIAYNQPSQLRAALRDLEVGEQASHEIGAAGPWWVYRLTRRLLGDLGETSIRANIPVSRPPAATPIARTPGARGRDWGYLRRTFVATLFARGRSEIDLWPSQLHVVERIFDDVQDLVVALPTSSGKTRIAELCILACLAQGRRAVYVTPLRALSAQTEQILDRTFAPLGARVSSLYGSMGVSDVDEDALRSSQIVVTTPEKLDFALRSDPSVLDDVGLVVLDEGHMIGPSEREVRYEAQIQRLLRRADSKSRRIVCLSAVFPSGTELDDFVAWITDDNASGLHREDWRPTLQRFGLVEWRGDHARLTMTVGEDQPFIPRYLETKAPTGRRRKKPFPSDNRELVIATAWRLVEEGQTVLIFCPQRNSVEPYAREIIKLRSQGFIDSVLPPEVDLDEALAVGSEWFGADHPILGCLKLGVAIHHGALPGPFRREVERLLHLGVIKVTVASPTLAQGLNLSASVVLFHGLRRGRELLTGSEFANVIGRAGRAFVDTEGLVLYPLYQPTERRRRDWLQLTAGEAGKTLRSGLITVSLALIRRMRANAGSNQVQPFIDYLTGGADWAFPVIPGEDAESRQEAELSWRSNLMLLDTGILSIAGDDESDPDEVTQLIADVLRDSLWERQLRRLERQDAAAAFRELVSSRARYVWSISTAAQRRGWYLAGLGANAGSELGVVAADIVTLIAEAESAIEGGDTDIAGERLDEIATTVFGLSQFEPETDLHDWGNVLAHWLHGRPLGELDGDAVSVAQFIESDLIYRLVWGMEAARVYESAQGNETADALLGTAVTAIETGTFSRAASILIRSGFDHRAAAIAAVTSTVAAFESRTGMQEWIRDLDPDLTSLPNWPTIESHAAWRDFTNRASRSSRTRWRRHIEEIEDVTWYDIVPEPNAWLRVTDAGRGKVQLWSTGFDLLGEGTIDINSERQGVLHARRLPEPPGVKLLYRGPADLLAPDA